MGNHHCSPTVKEVEKLLLENIHFHVEGNNSTLRSETAVLLILPFLPSSFYMTCKCCTSTQRPVSAWHIAARYCTPLVPSYLSIIFFPRNHLKVFRRKYYSLLPLVFSAIHPFLIHVSSNIEHHHCSSDYSFLYI